MEEKHLIWNERNPKIISTKYVPHEDLVENPKHATSTQIKEEKIISDWEKANLLPEGTDVKEVKTVSYDY